MFEIADPRFNARTDEFIAVANKQANDAAHDKVSLSFLDGSCRYYAWLWAATSKDEADFAAKRAQALEVLLTETRQRFEKHADDYAKNFQAYIVAQRKPRTPQP